jgi:PAS domain S-box-containing protein
MDAYSNLIPNSKKELLAELRVLQKENTQLKSQLNERHKHLNILSKVSSLTKSSEPTLNSQFHEIAELIPQSMQYPDVACVKITIYKREYKTSNFEVTKWKLSETIWINNEAIGYVDVFYLKEKPECDEGPFLNEEKGLLKIIASILSKSVENYNLQEKLIDSEEKFLLSFQNSPVGKCIVDKTDNFRFLHINERFLTITGFSREELEGRYLHEIKLTSNDGLNALIFPSIKQGNVIKDLELTFQNKRGKIKTGVINIETINVNSKALSLVVINDITERKEAEKKNRQQEKKLQAIFDNMQDAFFQADSEGNFVYVNPMALQMYGYHSEEEILGKPASRLYAKTMEREELIEKLKKTRKVTDYTSEALRKDGTTFWVSMNVQFLYDDDGVISGTQGVVRDISERAEFENRLQESEKRFRDIFENMPSGYILFELIYDEDGKPIDHRLIEANAEFDNYTGLKRSEQLGRTSKELSWYWPEDVTQRYYDVAMTGKSFSYERFNGSLDRYYDIRVSSPGKGQFALLFNDITKRKKAEEERFELLTRFKQIAKHIPGFIYQYHLRNDNTSYFPYASEGIQEVYGVTAEQAMENAQCVFDVIHPDDLQRVSDSIYESAKNMTIWNESYRVNLPTEKTIWVEGKSTPLKLADGSVLWHGYIQDITDLVNYQDELIKAREKAEESDFRLQLAVDSGKLGIWDFNVIDNTLIWNKRMYELYGMEESKFPESLDIWEKGLHPEDRDRASLILNQALTCGKDFNLTFRVVHPDKTVIHLSADAIVLRDKNNQPFRMIGINRDITEVVERENELVKAKQKAEESDRLKSAFLLNISHEIRTPMNGILGFMSLLNEPGLEEQERLHFMNVINKSGNRLMDTINDIVEISKIEIGDIKVNLQEVKLQELMQYYYYFFSIQANEKGLKFTFSKHVTGERALIKSDRHKLDGIMMNLIKNAIKFTEKGEIEIGNYLEDDKLWFYVSDTGIGIPEDKLDVIFNRFVQADTGYSRGYEGSGIGLSIVKAYVEALNGTVHVKSEIGKGSTFYFYIPYIPVKSISEMPETIPTITKRVEKPVVLIAEDDKVNYYLLETILSKDFKILHAENGEEAIDLFQKNNEIALILMDIKMPGVYNGLDATRKIRETNNQIPIIAQTACAIDSDKSKAMESGCNDYISKPYSPDELKLIIQKHLKRLQGT